MHAVEEQRDRALEEVRDHARRHGIGLELTPAGMAVIPLAEGQPMTPAQFQAVPEADRAAFEAQREEIEHRMEEKMRELRALDEQARERVRKLDREVALFAVGHLIDALKARFAEPPALGRWLDQVREDVLANLGAFQHGEQEQVPAPLAAAVAQATRGFFGRYAVNVFIAPDEDDTTGAPIVEETNPTYHGLFGRIEYESTLGAVATDHRHLRAGAMHRANGGYLVLDALEVLRRPFLWDKLKDVLRTRRIRLENLAEQYTMLPTTTLSPEPIDVELKVILIGPPELHRLLLALDPEMRELFRVKAEFDVSMPWLDEGVRQYAAFIGEQARERGLPHFDAGAVARVVEHGARAVEHQEKLSSSFLDIADLVVEACHWCQREDGAVVRKQHVERAIEEKVFRSNMIEERIDELIAEGTLMIDVDGALVGQVNGLSVAELGDYRFGRPVRITAATAAGRGELVSIDREAELSGAIHDKGFLALSGYLGDRYGQNAPLSLAASLTFEQSYAGIEGDSAASAELYALLSSLAGAPVKQSIAVTGSVNQHGWIQPISAVNEKVEGFYAVCDRRGLTGDQGVIVPRANLKNLMLKDDVVEAVRRRRFHVWGVASAEEGLEILTELRPGERDEDGAYPEGSLHRRVEDRLRQLARVGRQMRATD